jgi:hypothetical protein
MNYATKEDLENLKREIEKAFEKLNLAINITNSDINLNKKYCPHISQTCDNSGACKCNYCGEFIEDVKPKKEPWELYPDYESCLTKGNTLFYYTVSGHIDAYNADEFYYSYSCHNKKLAKRQLAELQLAKIADKWGEGIEYSQNGIAWSVNYYNNKLACYFVDIDIVHFSNPLIRFKTEEQCKKSIELHHQLWKDWFMID